MADNIKIRTEDVDKILDTKITTISSHLPLDVSSGEFYDSVLAKIAARSPTFDEKNALTNASIPSASNPYVTVSHLNLKLDGRIPWKTVGPTGSGSDYEGETEAIFGKRPVKRVSMAHGQARNLQLLLVDHDTRELLCDGRVRRHGHPHHVHE
jgi:hypothetical protein